jgi:dephospho-CoA kinase
MFILGLTGSLGMGKSATAKMFAEQGVPVHDADAAVHQLYESEATPLIEAAFPGTTAGGKVNRDKLAQRVLGDTVAIKKLEAIVHPLVRNAEERFLARHDQTEIRRPFGQTDAGRGQARDGRFRGGYVERLRRCACTST